VHSTRRGQELLVPGVSKSETRLEQALQVTKNVEEQGIDPCASRMLSERSTI
jgi:hypothetical protein